MIEFFNGLPQFAQYGIIGVIVVLGIVVVFSKLLKVVKFIILLALVIGIAFLLHSYGVF